MRLLTLGVLAVVILAAILFLYSIFLPEVHVSALVPADARFGLLYSSVNDLRELYAGPTAPTDFDPALQRIGKRVNVPELDGIDFDEPVGSFFTGEDNHEVWLVPFQDSGAYEEAFDRSRENIHLKGPDHPSRNYLSVSTAGIKPKRGPEHALAKRIDDYTVLLFGRPETGDHARFMLTYLLALDGGRRQVPIPMLGRVVADLPDAVAGFIAQECEDFLVGVPGEQDPTAPLRIDLRATPPTLGTLARAEKLARKIDLAQVMGSFPRETRIAAGGVLDEEGWRRLRLPFPVGDSVFAAGIVERKYHGRPFNLLLAARPADERSLAALEASGHLALLKSSDAQLTFGEVSDRGTKVRSAEVAAPPAWLSTILRTSQQENPPPIYLSIAVERGIWYCALGSQSEHTVRSALGCLRGAEELSLRRAEALEGHREFFKKGHVAMALLAVEGTRALRHPMPFVELANFGQPTAVSFVVDVDGEVSGDLRLMR